MRVFFPLSLVASCVVAVKPPSSPGTAAQSPPGTRSLGPPPLESNLEADSIPDSQLPTNLIQAIYPHGYPDRNFASSALRDEVPLPPHLPRLTRTYGSRPSDGRSDSPSQRRYVRSGEEALRLFPEHPLFFGDNPRPSPMRLIRRRADPLDTDSSSEDEYEVVDDSDANE